MTTLSKGTAVDTTNRQPGELINMDFYFYNVTSIHGFTSMITVVYANTRMLWVFLTAPKRAPARITRFILTKLRNEKYPLKYVRVDEYGALENLTDVTNLIFD